MRIPESELIINSDGSAFHIHMKPEQLSDNIILVGDQGRVEMFKPMFDTVECENASREFVWFTGTHNGKRFTVLSTGIGTDNLDIVMTELDALANVDFKTREEKPVHRTLNILRLGTCGAIQPDIPIGSFIFSHVSIGCDGLLNWYANRDNVSDPVMEKAFFEQVRWDKHLPTPYFVHASDYLIDKFKDCSVKGVTIAASGFYGPQGRSVRLGLALPHMLEDFENYRCGEWRITNFEMEGSALAGLAKQLGHNGGTMCCVIANRYAKEANTDYKPFVKKMLELAVERLSQ